MEIRWVIDEEMEDDVYEIHSKRSNELFEELIQQNCSFLSGNSDGKKYLIPLNEVIAVSTENRQLVIQTMHQNYVSKKRLYEIEEVLPSGFVKISQSEIVRIDKIRCFHKTGLRNITIELENGAFCPISRRYLARVKKALERI